MTDRRAAHDLCALIDASPSPYHAVAELARRLADGGFTERTERDRWELRPGEAFWVTRDGSTIAAVRVGRRPPADAGFRIVGAHTDSPTFKLRPVAEHAKHGHAMVGVETYGGPLLHTWMDRDLTVAGRVVTGDGAVHLVHLDGAPLRIPSLAIHLDREIWDRGLKLDRQRHMVAVHSAVTDAGGLMAAVAAAAGVHPDEVLGHDLVLADTQPSRLGGREEEFVFAPRQDNLTSCHAAVTALVAADPADATQVVVCNDHEEVGSGSAEGARGPFLEDVLRRVLAATGDADPQSLPRAVAASVLLSVDCAHAVHPNYADRHEGAHQPRLGGGPVLKVDANQAYATDGRGAAWFAARCADAGVPHQAFVNRGDLPGGSTIGPLTATRLGLPTVDVGNPLLSMHSIREQGATADVAHLTAALTAHLTA